MSRKQKWEMAMAKVDQLISDSNGNLFDRAILLMQVWDDPEFMAFHGSDVDKADEHLSQKLGDYGLSFFDVKSMLEYYPSRDKWTAGKIREMLAYALEQEEAKRVESKSSNAVVRKGPVPRKEFETLQKQAEFVQKQAETWQSEVDRLRDENARLRRELDRASGRIEELEKLLHKERV